MYQGGEGPAWSKMLAAALGVGGAGLGAYTGRNYTKQASMGGSGSQIATMLSGDPSLSFSDKADLLRSINLLNMMQQQQLASVLRTAGGAGVGALIAKFLLKMGAGGQVAGALIGGSMGRGYSNGFLRNKRGERTRPGYNVYGQPF